MTWSIASYNGTPSGNTTINGINIAEGCNASNINDAIRQLMADLAVPQFAGPVGIGMVPVNALDITQAQNAASYGRIYNTSAGAAASANWSAHNGTAGTNMGVFGTGYATNGVEQASRGFLVSSAPLAVYTSNSNPIIFGTNTTERVRITPTGDVQVATGSVTIPGAQFNADTGSGSSLNLSGFAASVTLAPQSLQYTYGGGFDIKANTGTGQHLDYSTGAWSSISDERAKTDLTPITGALDLVDGIRTVTGRYIADEARTIQPFMIAQDWQSIAPALTPKKWKDDAESDELYLAYAQTTTYAFACIKELKALVEAQAVQIAALEAKLA